MVMDKFETQFEDMDVQADYMESAMNGANAMSTPQADVDDLLQQVAEEAGLELKHELGGAAIPAEALPIPSPAVREPDQLMERLAKLRNS
jgi:charged multivesicular body protein 1